MKEFNMPGFLVYVLMMGLIVIAFTIGIFLGTRIDKKDSEISDDNIVNLTGDFVRAEVRFMDGYVMTKRLSGCVYHKDTGMFEVAMIQVSGKSAVYYVAPENLTLINMTDDIDKMGE